MVDVIIIISCTDIIMWTSIIIVYPPSMKNIYEGIPISN